MSIEVKGGGATDLLKVGTDGAGKVNLDGTGVGRVQVVVALLNFTASATEALLTPTIYRDGVAGATATTHPITAGKRLRITNLSVSCKNAGAAGQGCRVMLRWNPAGAAIVSSPPLAMASAGTYLAIANVVGGYSTTLPPNGIDIGPAGQIGISDWGSATAGNDVVLNGYEYTP